MFDDGRKRERSGKTARRAACETKEQMTAEQADRVAKGMRRRKSGKSRDMVAYRCDICGMWHIGGRW